MNLSKFPYIPIKSSKILSKRAGAFFLITLTTLITLILVITKGENRGEQKSAGGTITSSFLSLNTDKSHYVIGEQVNISIISLDASGNPLCDSNLQLEVINPQSPKYPQSPPIAQSPACNPENSTSLNPDYSAHFTPEVAGEYQIKLTNLDNNESNQVSITVSEEALDISLSRWGASKVTFKESSRYPMKLTLTTSEDLTGQLIEQVPASLEIVWQGAANVEKQEENQTITWKVDLQAGETKEFTYEYTVSGSSPGSLSLGPAQLVSDSQTMYEESRHWQLIINN